MTGSKAVKKDLLEALIDEEIYAGEKAWEPYRPINESWAAYLEMKQKGMSYRELSEIEMEIEAVKTIDDKRYINYRIQDDMAIVLKYIEKIEKNDASFMNARDLTAADLKKYKDFYKQLQELYKKLVRRHPKGKEYGIIHEIY